MAILYSVSYSETYLNNNMHYINIYIYIYIYIYMQAKQCNSTHYILTHYLNPFWPIHPIPFSPGEMPQEVMSCFFCVHSAKSGLRSAMSFSVYTTMAPAMTPTINLGTSNEPTVLYAGNLEVTVLLRRKM